MERLFIVTSILSLASASIKLQAVKQFAAGEAHNDMVSTLSFYNDGSKFVTGSKDYFVKVWSMSDFSNLYTSPAYADEVMHITLHPDDNRIFVLTYDGVIEVLDPVTYMALDTRFHPLGGLSAGAYLRFIDSNTKYVIGGYDDTAGNNQIVVFDASTYNPIGGNYPTSFSNFDEITIMSVSRDGSTLAAISANAVPPIQVEIYDVAGASISRTFSDNFEVMKWILFSPYSDDTLYTTSNDQTLKLFKKSPVDSTYSLALTFYTDDYGYPNGINANIPNLLIFSANDKLVFLNTSQDYPQVEATQTDQEDIFVLDLSPDKLYIGTGMRNGQITIWKFLEEGEDEGSQNNYSLLIVVGCVIGGLLFILLIFVVIYCCCCQKKRVHNRQSQSLENQNDTQQNIDNPKQERDRNSSSHDKNGWKRGPQVIQGE